MLLMQPSLNYDDTFDLSSKAVDGFSWYCHNTSYNPFTVEDENAAAGPDRNILSLCSQRGQVIALATGSAAMIEPTLRL